MALQHLRSSTANKRPLPAGMSDGQLAINTNNTSPGLFFKDSAGALVKVGPVHVGTTAPNASPASGGETGNTVGEQWLDTTGGTYVFKVWDGSAWRSESGTFVDVNGDVMTGALGIIAGTAGSPGLYISGDTNTGIYSPGADQLALSTNSTGRLFVDSSGRVGVGTGGTQLSTFHVEGTSRFVAANSALFNGTTGTYSTWQHNGTAVGDIGTGNQVFAGGSSTDFAITARSATSLVFGTNTTERMRLDSSGRLGIGDSSPSARLVCNGHIQVTGNGVPSSGAGLEISYGQIGAGRTALQSYSRTGSAYLGADYDALDHRLYTSGTERMRLTSTGLGIGTTSASATLTLVANSSAESIRALGRSSDNVGQIFVASNSGTDYGGLRGASDEVRLSTFGALPLTFHTNGGERGRFDTSGRLLVGTSSSSNVNIATFQGNSSVSTGTGIVNIALGNTSPGTTDQLGRLQFTDSGHNSAAEIIGQRDGGTWNTSTSRPTRLVFSTCPDSGSSPVERMRISADGTVLIGKTSASHTVAGNWIAPGGGVYVAVSGAAAGFLYNQVGGGNGTAALFRSNNVDVGSISVTGSATAYNTSSDYRLKENVTPVTDGITRLQQLKPSRFNFIADPGTVVDGFIAHEVQTVVPEAITGEKDAVDADGNPVYQGIDQSKLVPLLTAALQEAVAKIERLEARLTAAGI